MLSAEADTPPRAWLVAGACAAVLLMLVLVALISQPAGSGQGRTTTRSAAPATGGETSTAFGSSAPGDKFIQAFQQQVTQELHATLDYARREQEQQLRQSELRQREQAAEQLETIQRIVAESHPSPQSPQSPRAPFGQQRPEDDGDGAAIEAPRIHLRAVRARDDSAGAPADDDIPPGARPGFALDPAAVRAIESSGTADAQPGRVTVGLGSRDAPRPGAPNIAPHGFIEGRLLNGVVAVVGGADRESIVALSGPYQAANGFDTNLDGCFALVQGRPEAAAGRIDFKVSRLTCNFDDGASKTWDVAGWLVDSDGIRGLRATIVQSLDKKAAVAALGGAVGGIGRRLSQQQYQSNAGPAGSTSSFIGNPARDAAGGAAEGAASAIQQSIGDYYQLFAPSLQVGGGTPVTVVIANELAVPPSGRSATSTHAATP
jgi:hypothetical protein